MSSSLRDADALSRTVIRKSYTIGTKNISLETGRLALFADGAVVIEDTDGNFLLTTAGIGAAKDADFFPMSVEFQEKYYAAGKIGGNRFMKREGRPSDGSILNSRMIDRPIRPMFPKGTRTEVQIISTIMSSSGVSDFGWYGITGASLSLMLAGVEGFEGPVAGVRICSDVDGNFIFDPTFDQIRTAHLDLTVAGTLDAITMVESQGQQVENALMVRAFEYAHTLVKQLCSAQIDFVAEYTKVYTLRTTSLKVVDTNPEVYTIVAGRLKDADIQTVYGLWKLEFHDAMDALVNQMIPAFSDQNVDTKEWEYVLGEWVKKWDIYDSVKKVVAAHMRRTVLDTGIRLDGRKCDEVRPVRTTAAILPRVHGSALFERGVTQVLSVATLGGPGDIQIVDDMYEESEKRYIHHYNFPPYSVGEVKPLRGVGRREIGHGRLAEKALEPVLPSAVDFPYMMRVVSETTTCNGSSSMASVCGSTMALMDAGVPIRSMVAGVAMGMIYDDETGKYRILADIQAQEDFLGDMDFKVARTSAGITALQMDCKIAGLSMDVIREVFDQSVHATTYIQGEMAKCLSAPRASLSPYAPYLLSIQVPQDKMREVIGKGGETIQGIEKDYSVEVNLADDGVCTITAKDQVSGNAALEFIKNILKDVEVGDVYDGKIVKILDTVGAIVEIGKWKEGMVHISKFGVRERIEDVNTVAKLWQIIKVKVYSVDKEKGRIGLEKMV